MTRNPHQDASRAFAAGGAVAVALLGAAVLLGWTLDIPWLTTLPGGVAMKANTALGFLVAGPALLALRIPPTASRRAVARMLAGFVLAIGVVTTLEYLAGATWPVDQLLIHDASPLAANAPPGRMAPSTALSFVFAGAALLLTRRRTGSGSPARWLAIPPLFIAVLAIIGYAYGVNSLYALGPFIPMALTTALGFLVLSLSIITVDPTDGFMGILTSDTTGALSARRLLPFTTLLLFLLGWVRLVGQRAGAYDTAYGAALTAIGSIVITSSVVAWHAYLLHKADLKRRDDDARILALNATLTQRVEQLGELLPICAWCKQIRDTDDHWHSIEEHISARTTTRFTHAMCPACARRMGTDASPAA